MSSTSAAPVPEGRTRWGHFAAATAVVTAMAAAMIYLAATGALAVSFQMSGIPFKLSASNMSGHGFVQYAVPDTVTNSSTGHLGVPGDSVQGGSDGKTYVASTVTRLHDASIADLHQTVCAPVPSLFGITPKTNLLVTIDAGRGGTPATATGLIVDAPLMTASNAQFWNINIGQDLGNALGTDSNGLFAQNAERVSIDNLDQLSIGTQAGTFNLTGLNLGATFVDTCP